MSNKCMNWVYTSSKATLAERLVLLALADEADDDGSGGHPSINRIASKALVSKATAIRCIDRLEQAGDLLVFRPEKNGRGHFNRYVLVMGADPAELRGRVEKDGSRLRPFPEPEKGAKGRGKVHAPTQSGTDPLTHIQKQAVAEQSDKPSLTPEAKAAVKAEMDALKRQLRGHPAEVES